MATLPGRPPRGPGMGSSNTHAEPGLWDYSVPMNESSSGAEYDESSEDQQHPALHNHVNDANRTAMRRKTKSNQDLDSAYAASETGTYSRDSVSGTRSLPRDKSRSSVRRKGSLGALSALDDDPENWDAHSKWIHRDKLAAIESRELAEMGFRMSGRPSRVGSHIGKKDSKTSSIDLGDDYQYEDGEFYHEEKRQRIASASLFGDTPIREEADEEFHEASNTINNDDTVVAAGAPAPAQAPAPAPALAPASASASAAPPAAAAAQATPNSQPQRQRKQSVSKIPVSKHSPSQEHVSPPSTAGEFGYQTHRTRSSSNGSGIVVDQTARDPVPQRKGSTPGVEAANKALQSSVQGAAPAGKNGPASPTQAQTPTQPGQPRTARTPTKASPETQRPKSGTSSNSGSTKRPGSSDGPTDASALPAEQDPPWMSSLYKPDPRLPPDQQMLPTHAKRLAQEREERQRLEREAQLQAVQDRLQAERDQEELERLRLEDLQARAAAQQTAPQQPTQYAVQAVKTTPEARASPSKPTFAAADQAPQQQNGVPETKPRNAGTTVTVLKREEIVQQSAKQSLEKSEPRQNGEWPLRTPSPTKEEFSNINFLQPAGTSPQKSGPGSATSENRNNGVTPTTVKILQQPEQDFARGPSPQPAGILKASSPQPSSAPSPVPRQSTQTQNKAEVTRVPEAPEPNEKEAPKEKGCACCVVM